MFGTLAKAMLYMALGQTPGDVIFSNSRAQKVEANFPESRRAEIRELVLYASQDQGETWGQVSRISPEQREFTYSLPVDGAFWLRVAVVTRAGKQEPENLYKVAPHQKLIVDTLKPLVRITSAVRNGNEVSVGWEIREDHPEWSTFRLEYTTVPGGAATPVQAAPGLTGVARFNPSTNGTVFVRLVLKDKAGNETQVTADVAGRDAFAGPAVPPSAVPPLPQPAATTSVPPPPGEITTALAQYQQPAAAVPPPIAPPPAPTEAYVFPPVENSVVAAPSNPPAKTAPVQERPKTFTPPVPLHPVGTPRGWSPAAAPIYQAQERPIASTDVPVVQAQYTPPAPAHNVQRKNLPTVQYVNSPEVVLEYELSKVGPSGVGSVDIFLTQDDGQNWEHVASDPMVIGKREGGRHQGIVELPGDGVYGFSLVVKSQAQLKQDMANQEKRPKGPRGGDVPEIRVEVDTMPPTAEMFTPRRDTTKPNSLLLVWTAADKNLGTNPVTLEWAERREGPWTPIANNIANTGKHSWQLPNQLPVQVYMRLRVRDLAGNEGVAVTPDPQLVDLSEPEGRLLNVTVSPRR